MRHLDVRGGLYRDSVELMRISAELGALDGVGQAFVAMATPTNLDLLATMGFPAEESAKLASPNDMLIALDATDADALAHAMAHLEVALHGGASPGGALVGGTGIGGTAAITASVAPRTVGSAVRRFGATVALVSTPGRYAFVEAMDALDAGVSVMVFSDNVSVAQEVLLKQTATQRGLLVLGPDCGTAVISGVGLGFANVVRPGPVGLVAASGTGAQQVMALLGWAGVGISHCLGVGGRDLSQEVAGRSSHTALDALDADPATDLIVLVSKPPDAQVAAATREHAARLTTDVHFATLGPGEPDLTAATELVLHRLGRPAPDPWPHWLPHPGQPGFAGPPSAGPALWGLFCGGTLCAEAQSIAHASLPPELVHLVDLGADEFTVDRPHPMIDSTTRIRRIATVAADPTCQVLLLDVVLGHGAHPDPAPELAAAITAARVERAGRDLAVVVSLIGTPDDPQDPIRQATTLVEAGAAVFVSNAAATRYAVELIGGTR